MGSGQLTQFSENTPEICPLVVQIPSIHTWSTSRSVLRIQGEPSLGLGFEVLLKNPCAFGADHIIPGTTGGGSQFHCPAHSAALFRHQDQKFQPRLGTWRTFSIWGILYPKKGLLGLLHDDTMAAEMAKGGDTYGPHLHTGKPRLGGTE